MTDYKNVSGATPGIYIISLDPCSGEVMKDPVVQWAWLDDGLYPLPVTLTKVIDPEESYCLLLQDGSVSKVDSDSTKHYANVDAWLAEQRGESK